MKNPLFYEKTNANLSKIRRARKIMILSLLCIFSVVFITTVSIHNPASGKAVATDVSISLGSLAFLPMAAGVKGLKAVNGIDETEEDFLARKGKAESDIEFGKRFMKHTVDEAIKKANEEWKVKYEALSSQIAGIKTPEEFTKLKEEMTKHGLDIKALQETAVIGDRSIKKGSIAETLAKNKEKIDGFMSGKTGKNLVIEHKGDAQTETSTDITNRSNYAEWHEGGRIGQIPVRRPFLRNLFKNLNAGTEYIKYTDQNTVVRDAQNVALCATSTGNTKATWIVRTMQIQKVRDFIDICNDMMTDYLFVQGEVQNLLDSSVKLKIDDNLLNGTGVAPQTNGLASFAGAWAPNIAGIKDYTNTIANANIVDLISVAAAQIRQLGQNNAWMPNYVLVNPGDYELMLHLKNTLGDTVKFNPTMFVDNGGNIYIRGMLVIDNPNITENTFWIGDFSRGTVYSIPGVGIEFSYENATNFETETVTVKAYERLNLLVRNVDVNAFMKNSDINASLALINKV